MEVQPTIETQNEPTGDDLQQVAGPSGVSIHEFVNEDDVHDVPIEMQTQQTIPVAGIVCKKKKKICCCRWKKSNSSTSSSSSSSSSSNSDEEFGDKSRKKMKKMAKKLAKKNKKWAKKNKKCDFKKKKCMGKRRGHFNEMRNRGSTAESITGSDKDNSDHCIGANSTDSDHSCKQAGFHFPRMETFSRRPCSCFCHHHHHHHNRRNHGPNCGFFRRGHLGHGHGHGHGWKKSFGHRALSSTPNHSE